MEKNIFDEKLSQIITKNEIINHLFVETDRLLTNEDFNTFIKLYENQLIKEINHTMCDLLENYFREYIENMINLK
jgi:hypothetical protein